MAENTPRVRLAMPQEANVIAALQRRAWASDPVGTQALAQISDDEMIEAWRLSIERPPLATYRVLVAVHDDGTKLGQVVGFAAIGPSDDEDADPSDALVAEFVVDDDAEPIHADQLINAIGDTLRADGFWRATWWLKTTDDAMRAFLTQAGWAPDGAHRTIGTDEAGELLRQVRLHTSLSDGQEPDDSGDPA